MAITHTSTSTRVQADVISTVTATTGGYNLLLASGLIFFASTAMTAIHMPVANDYLVTCEDGFQYLGAKVVFERQYIAIPVALPVDPAVDTGGTRRIRLDGRYETIEP